MIRLSKQQFLNLLNFFEQSSHSTTNKDNQNRQKRQQWTILEESMSDPFTSLDQDSNGLIEWNELPLSLRDRYPNHQNLNQRQFEHWMNILSESGDEWAFSYNQSRQWLHFIVNQTLSTSTAVDPPKTIAQPTLLLSYGPPGSGKTSIINYYLQGQNEVDHNHLVDINLDKLTRHYMNRVLNRDELFGDHEFYFKIRSKWPLLARDTLIREAIHSRRDLLIETTGRTTSAADNIIMKACQNGYRVVLVYILVPFADLVLRVTRREQETGQGHPPFEKLLELSIESSSNLVKYQEIMSQSSYNQIILIDNSNSNIARDSMTPCPKKICDHHQLQQYLSQPGIIPEIAKNLSNIEIRYEA